MHLGIRETTPVIGFGDAAGDTGHGVAVPADGDGFADGILKTGGFEKSNDRLGHGTLAGHVKGVPRANFIQGAVQVIGKAAGDFSPDVCLGGALAGEQHRQGGGLGALDPLGMVMGHLSAALRLCQYLVDCVKGKPHRADPHGRAVAPAVIGLRVFSIDPTVEVAAIPAPGIAPGESPGRLRYSLSPVMSTLAVATVSTESSVKKHLG
jgi:hypothetical protein